MSTEAHAKITLAIEYVDPLLARYYLYFAHEENRPIDWMKVRKIAQDIIHDRWKLNNHLLAFDPEDRLVDGQHRLHAIVVAGMGVEVGVMRNLPWHD